MLEFVLPIKQNNCHFYCFHISGFDTIKLWIISCGQLTAKKFNSYKKALLKKYLDIHSSEKKLFWGKNQFDLFDYLS